MPNDKPNHSPGQFMIALYYWYIEIPTQSIEDQVIFHESLCKELTLNGRIRISNEGLNGVLSGTVKQLKNYEQTIRLEMESKFRLGIKEESNEHESSTSQESKNLEYGQTLDVKYCHLREDIPTEKQLFDSLSVKITKEVVSLNEGSDENDTSKKEAKGENQAKKKRRRRKKNKGDRYEQIMEEDRRKKEEEERLRLEQQQQRQESSGCSSQSQLEKEAMLKIENYQPATHLSPKEWNEHLLNEQPHVANDTNNTNNHEENSAILIDARNIYESKIGYFTSKNVPTLLTNTRKYSTITSVFNQSMEHLAGKNVYMYCTGGVRCERASVYLQALADSDAWPDQLERPKKIFQLEGGIQKYLEQYGTLETKIDMNGSKSKENVMKKEENIDECTKELKNLNVVSSNQPNLHQETPINPQQVIQTTSQDPDKDCLFRGKNFVFDPRRYDPVVGKTDIPIGKCITCSKPCDDYDNKFAPCENREARCCRCRVLVLVCGDCRRKVHVWGQEEEEVVIEVDGTATRLPDVFCGPGGKECIDEGNSVDHYTIVHS